MSGAKYHIFGLSTDVIDALKWLVKSWLSDHKLVKLTPTTQLRINCLIILIKQTLKNNEISSLMKIFVIV